MIKFSAAGLSVLALIACSSEESGSFTDEDGNTVEYSVESDGAEATATVYNEDGTATMTSGKNVDVDLPDGFTIYPGADVQMNTSFTADDGKGGLINMSSDASPEDMAGFYRKQATDAGLKITLESTMGDRVMLTGEKEGGVSFTFGAGPSGGKTEAQLMFGEGL